MRRGRIRLPTQPPNTRSPASPRPTSLDGRKYDIAVGQIDIGNAASEMASRMREGIAQPSGEIRPEPVMDLDNVGARGLLYGEPAARCECAVHDGDGNQDAVRRPRLIRSRARAFTAAQFRWEAGPMPSARRACSWKGEHLRHGCAPDRARWQAPAPTRRAGLQARIEPVKRPEGFFVCSGGMPGPSSSIAISK